MLLSDQYEEIQAKAFLETKRIEFLDKARELQVNERVLFMVQNTHYVRWSENVGAMEGEHRIHISEVGQHKHDTNRAHERNFVSSFPCMSVSGQCCLELESKLLLNFSSDACVNSHYGFVHNNTWFTTPDNCRVGTLCNTDPPQIDYKCAQQFLSNSGVPGLTVKDLLVYAALCAGILEYTCEYSKMESEGGIMQVPGKSPKKDERLKWWQNEDPTFFQGFTMSRRHLADGIRQRYEERKEALARLFCSFNWNYYYSYVLCPDKSGSVWSFILEKEVGPAHVGVWQRTAEEDDKKAEEAAGELNESERKHYYFHPKCKTNISGVCSLRGNEVIKIV